MVNHTEIVPLSAFSLAITTRDGWRKNVGNLQRRKRHNLGARSAVIWWQCIGDADLLSRMTSMCGGGTPPFAAGAHCMRIRWKLDLGDINDRFVLGGMFPGMGAPKIGFILELSLYGTTFGMNKYAKHTLQF